MDAAAWGFIGTIIGALASIATSWMAAKAAQSAESERARHERVEKARELQRATILELQETIHDCTRNMVSTHHHDLIANRTKGVAWGKNMLPENLNEGMRLTFRRAAILLERLQNAELREGVRAFTQLYDPLVLAQSEEDAGTAVQRAVKESMRLIQALGTELRLHYSDLNAIERRH